MTNDNDDFDNQEIAILDMLMRDFHDQDIISSVEDLIGVLNDHAMPKQSQSTESNRVSETTLGVVSILASAKPDLFGVEMLRRYVAFYDSCRDTSEDSPH